MARKVVGVILHNGKRYLSLNLSASICGFSKEYFRKFIKSGELRAQRINDLWFIEESTFTEFCHQKGFLKKTAETTETRKNLSKEFQDLQNKLSETTYAFERFRLRLQKSFAIAVMVILIVFYIWNNPSLAHAAYTAMLNTAQTISTVASTTAARVYGTPYTIFSNVKEATPFALGVMSHTSNTISKTSTKLTASVFTIVSNATSLASNITRAAFSALTREAQTLISLIIPAIPLEPQPEADQPSAETLAINPPEADQASTPTLQSQPTIIQKTVNQTIINTTTGLTQQDLDIQLSQLNNELRKAIYSVRDTSSQRSTAVERAVALTNKIDKLTSVIITNSTISGTLTGLTDAHIPNTITASNYLPLTGGTLTSNLTVLGTLTTSGTQTFFDTLTIPQIIATSTTASSFIQASSTRLSITDTLYIGGTATTTIDSGGNTSIAGTLTVSGISSFTEASTTVLFTQDLMANIASFGGTATTSIDSLGLLTVGGGFISNASSTIAGPFHISDHLSASSTMTVEGLSILNNGYISRASSTIAGPFHISDNFSASSTITIGGVATFESLSTFTGFISNASSTISSSLHISDIITGSSSIAIDNDAYFALTGGSVGIASSSPWGLLSVEIDATDIVNPAFVVSNQGSSTPAFYIDGSTGFVGIGTAAPAEKLVVTTDSADGILINIDSVTATDFASIGAHITTGSPTLSAAHGRIDIERVDASNGKLHLATKQGGTVTRVLTVNEDGNVGIGTTSPTELLSVHGGDLIVFNPSGTGDARIIIENNNGASTSVSLISTTADDFRINFKGPDFSKGDVVIIEADGDFRTFGSVTSCTIGNGTSATNCSTSDERLKDNITALTVKNGLEVINALNPVSFNWNAQMQENAAPTTTQFGFIAQDIQKILPNLVKVDENTEYLKLNYQGFVAPIVLAIQEIASRISLTSAPTTTPSIYIDSVGNVGIGNGTSTPQATLDINGSLKVDGGFTLDGSLTMEGDIILDGKIGIGTTTPMYDITVIGDIAAQSFINISTKETKKDIVPLEATTGNQLLTTIQNTNIYKYHYEGEDTSNPLRLGLIAEDAPLEVLSLDKRGVDLYKLATFTLAGVKELARLDARLAKKLETVEVRLQQVEELMTQGVPVLDVNDTNIIERVIEVFKERVVQLASLIIGSPEKPTGITLYDKETSEPYCLEIIGGVTTSTKGICGTTSSTTPDTTEEDTTPPTITIKGTNPAEIELGATYSDNGATVTDNVDNNLGYQRYLNGVYITEIQLDTSTTTTYLIDYVATDNAGNTATSTRTVTIIDPNAIEEVITTPEIIPDESATSPPEADQPPADTPEIIPDTATSTDSIIPDESATTTEEIILDTATTTQSN